MPQVLRQIGGYPMEHDSALPLLMAESFGEDVFLRRLGHNRADMNRLFGGMDWRSLLAPLLPITERLSCAQALEVFLPLLDKIALAPPEGWLKYAYQTAVSILYPQDDLNHAPPSGTPLSASCNSSGPSLTQNGTRFLSTLGWISHSARKKN